MALLHRTLASEMATVRDVIDMMAERCADAPFLISPETKEEVTYRDLQARVRELSRRFLYMGLTKGEKIAFLLENGLFSPQVLLGAMYGGFVPVPVNTVAGAAQVAYVLKHSDATVVFVSDEHRAMLSSLIKRIGRSLQIISAHPDHGPEWPHADTINTTLPVVYGDDDGLLVYTSGSTGHSKGVLFSQRSLLLNGLNTGSVYHLSPQDRSLCVLPLYHMNAIITTLFSTLVSGGSVVIPHSFSVTHFWEWVADFRCTWFALVPTIITHLVNWTDPYSEGKAERLRQIRFVRSSSAPLAPALHQAFEEKFLLLLVEGMGMTEASTLFMNPPSRDQRRIGSPGLPCHETKIVDLHGHTVPSGQTGEILIRGPRIMKGYYKNPEATAEVLSPDGWLRTGDLGYQDAGGYVFIVGRAKEIVIKGGENIAPREIDEALMQHAAVLEVAAVGVPDAYLGEDLVAYVVLKPEQKCSAQELLTHCAQILGEFKTPSRVYFVEDLPKGPSGKVQRLKLLERKTAPSTTHDPITAQQAQPNHPDQLQSEFVVPRTAVEEELIKIWENVLQRTPIGIYDNFFALGGHSLLAAGILTRVRDTFQVSLPLRVLFEAPTIVALAAQIETARHADDSLHLPPVQPLALDSAIPLSYAQQRLWFLEQLNPDTAAYNIPFVFRLLGPLDLSALQQALNALVARHEIFRTTFSSYDGNPQQIIADHLSISIPAIDISAWPQAQRETEALRLASEEVQRPFDLAQGPLQRTLVVQLSANDHLLIITWHHIIIDGWSLGVFTRELRVLYEAFSHSRTPTLPALPLQYADFAMWQRQWVQGEAIAKQVAYWKRQLAGVPPLLQLPTDHPRPAQQTYRGARLAFPISPSLTAALQRLSQQENVTLYITLLAAFQVLLSRYTGQEDIVVGSPIAGRVRPELEGLIGFFLNTLVLRTNLSHNPTFRALLHRARDIALDAYAHQDVPFEQLVEELHVPRALGYAPLVQVLFALQNVPRFALELPGVTSERVAVRPGTTKFDLSLLVWEEGDGLRGEVEYSTDLFEEPTITRLTGHYLTLLKSIVADPNQPIVSLPLLTSDDRHQLLVSWNGTTQAYDNTRCIHQLFEQQVEQTPNTIAVVYDGQQLTYRELNARANQLAHYLRKRDVGPDVLVGLCVERSLEMVVAILGILKAGGAYVPLDPTYPRERLAFMLEDTQALMLLTQQALVKSIPNYGGKILCLDSDWEGISRESQEELLVQTTPDSLAYIIYTSGSTGQPKGVQVTHDNVVHLLQATEELFHFNATDVWTLFHSFAFDLSVWELWGALCYGGRLVVVPYWVSRSPEAFCELLHTERVTVLNQTPSAFRQLMPAIFASAPPEELSLRYVIFGGEALELPGLKPWMEQYGDQHPRLVNMYGITETTVHVTYRLITWTDMRTEVGSVIGRPIPNLRVYVLDRYRQPVPLGVIGEMYVGGAGVARGYLRRPELTTERFIRNPFSADANARLYKSGDLARLRPNGELEYLGRSDQQVKIRGYRIELGEVETVLRQHPAIQDVVVALREDTPEDKRLVAYLVRLQSQTYTVSELRNFVQSKLPKYMVPSAFVFLDKLPLTPNGKVDRQALPAPDQSRPELAEGFVAPRTPLEEIITAVWCEVLGVERVGIHNNFFELGGHSLKATQVVARVRAILHIAFPLGTLFESPTVAGLAERIEAHRHKSQGVTSQPLQPVTRTRPLPLSFAQQRLWFLDQLEPGSVAYNIPAALRIRGPLDLVALERSVNEIVRRQESLRTTFALGEGEPIQMISLSLAVAVVVEDVQEQSAVEQKERVQALMRDEARRGFNLARGPLLRVKVVQLGEEDHLLLLTIHHIVSDAWSMGILFRELSVLYRAFTTQQPSPLPELPIQYADYVVWQREWLHGEHLGAQLAYWKRQLGGVSTVELPIDRPRPAVQTYSGGEHSVVIAPEVYQQLKNLSRQEGVTLFMTLLAAFHIFLRRYSGQEDVPVGTPIAGRAQPETEGLIGFFANTLVMRPDLTGDPTVRECVARVRRVALEAYDHQDLPFERLVQELNPDRTLSRHPLFQIMFTFHHLAESTLVLPNAQISRITIPAEIAKFDLSAIVTEATDSLRIAFTYNSDLFYADTIARMLGHFQTLLEGIVAQPEQPISELPLLTAEERHQLVIDWNDTTVAYPKYKRVHELFETQVGQTPYAIALVCDDQQLTYRELNAQANQLARYLQRFGVGPDVLVALCLDRSVDMVVGILAILKAGGAYVPLDPSYPQERLAFMLQDAQVAVLVTHAQLLSRLPDPECPIICLEKDRRDIVQESTTPPISFVTAEHLAYVLYTSGSSGQPKGVQIPHRALGNVLQAVGERLGLSRQDTLLAVTTFAFDIAALELLLPLTVGARVVVASRAVASDGPLLQQCLATSGATALQATPTTWRMLIDGGWQGNPRLKMLCGGEALTRELVQSLLHRGASLWNMYGPTETTIWSTLTRVATADTTPPIGCPLINTQVYILDPHLQPTPIGIPGELYIGGDGLARGYLHSPELTAERFIPHPFSREPGARLYRTGDRVRYLPDGNIEFLGRLDHQVKIRGYRIELGEVEVVLRQHPTLRDTVVVLREDTPGDKRLVAYLVLLQSQPPTVSNLRSFLRSKLPDYMIPSAFVFLDTLPRMPNGKIDWRALPPPEPTRPAPERASVAPRTPEEEIVTEVWREVLGLEGVGVHDNFFELGGHSLLAAQVVARINKRVQLAVPLRSLFECQTIAEMAQLIDEQQGQQVSNQTVNRLLSEIEAMSEEEAEQLLTDQREGGTVSRARFLPALINRETTTQSNRSAK